MQTETWIERVIINQLTTHDRRYKHDYGGVEQTTDDLVAACAQLDAILTENGKELPSPEQLLSMEAAFASEIESRKSSKEDTGFRLSDDSEGQSCRRRRLSVSNVSPQASHS